MDTSTSNPEGETDSVSVLDASERLRLARDGLINSSASIISGLVGIVLVPIMLRGLGAENYGLLIVASIVSGMAMTIDVGVGFSVTREIAATSRSGASEETVRFVRTAAVTYVALGLLGSLVIGGLGQPLSNWLKLSAQALTNARTVFVLIAISHFADRIFLFPADVLYGLRRFGSLNLLSVGAVVFRAAGVIVALSAGAGLRQVAAWMAVSAVLTTLAALLVIERTAPQYRLRLAPVDWTLLRRHLGFGFAAHLARKAADIIWQVPVMVIGFFLGSAALVPYSIGQRFPQKVSALIWVAAGVLFPAASKRDGTQDGKRSGEVLQLGTRWILVTALPICTVLWIIAPALLRAWLGDASPTAVSVLRLNSAAALVEALGLSGLHVLWGRGAARAALGVLTGTAIAVLGLTLWLLRSFGVAEAAWGTLIPMALAAGIILVLASHACGRPVRSLIRGSVGGLALPMAGCIAVTTGIVDYFHVTAWWSVIGTTMAGGTTYLLGLCFTPWSSDNRGERKFILESLRTTAALLRRCKRLGRTS